MTFGFNEKCQPVGAAKEVLEDEDFLDQAVYRIDWSRIPVLDLPEPVLERGDRAEAEHLYAADPEDLEWGINDLEHDEAFGSDFLPELSPLIAVKPEWLTPTVVALAHGIDDEREHSALPVLADALQEAGCEDAFFLHHCRQHPTAHAHGSWLPKLLVRVAEGKGPWLT